MKKQSFGFYLLSLIVLFISAFGLFYLSFKSYNFFSGNIFICLILSIILISFQQYGQIKSIQKEISVNKIFYSPKTRVTTFEVLIKGKCLFFMITEFSIYFGFFCFLLAQYAFEDNGTFSLNFIPFILLGLICSYIFSRFKTSFLFNRTLSQ